MLPGPFAFIFGAAMGSFLNVVIRRLPIGQSLIHPPSHCVNCNSPIAWYDNIPILSWAILRAGCRICGSKISIGYPAVELSVALLFVWLERCVGFNLQFAISAAFIASLVAVALIDLEHMIIPNVISIPGAIIAFAVSFMPGGIEPVTSLIGMTSGAAVLAAVIIVFHRLTGEEGMGWGDVKLLMFVGAFLGYKPLPIIFVIAGTVGVILGGGYMLIYKKGRSHHIPFGPFISLGAVLHLLEGDRLAIYFAKFIEWNLGWIIQ